MPTALDVAGQTFGMLTAIEPVGRGKRGVIWRCVCICGGEMRCVPAHLRNGQVRSCGCVGREALRQVGYGNRQHGHRSGKGNRSSPTYVTWVSMHARCASTDPKKRRYYLDRGITVCDQWKSFDIFLEDMGERPEGKTLDRWPDPSGNYEPTNCRWATPSEQRANQRRMLASKEYVSTLTTTEEDYLHDNF